MGKTGFSKNESCVLVGAVFVTDDVLLIMDDGRSLSVLVLRSYILDTMNQSSVVQPLTMSLGPLILEEEVVSHRHIYLD